MSKVIRFPPFKDLRQPAPPTLWQRVREFFKPPRKAPVFKIKNPTHLKLERARQKARGAL